MLALEKHAGFERTTENNVLIALLNMQNIMNPPREETLAQLANDLFQKRQRLLKAGQPNSELVDSHTAQALEAEYRLAELEYRKAATAFARAMKTNRQDS